MPEVSAGSQGRLLRSAFSVTRLEALAPLPGVQEFLRVFVPVVSSFCPGRPPATICQPSGLNAPADPAAGAMFRDRMEPPTVRRSGARGLQGHTPLL